MLGIRREGPKEETRFETSGEARRENGIQGRRWAKKHLGKEKGFSAQGSW